MEELTRMVADSLARHGFVAALDHRRLEWSRWFRCESSFSLLLVPSAAGLYALAEEVIAPGELPSASGKRLLAVFQVSETEDLCVALSRLFAPRNPLSARLSSGNCFVRFALIADQHERKSACESLSRWLASSTEMATGLAQTAVGSMTPATEQDGRDVLHESHALSSTSCHPERSEAQPNVVEGPGVHLEHPRPVPPFSQRESEASAGAPQNEPPPLPAGF